MPGAATAVPDFTFPVHGEDSPGALTGHGWGSHAFTGTALSKGAAPHAGEVVLGADAARTAKAGVGDTVVLETAGGRAGFRVSGLAEAGAGDTVGEGRAAGPRPGSPTPRRPCWPGTPARPTPSP